MVLVLLISELILYARVDVIEHLSVHEYPPLLNPLSKNKDSIYTDQKLVISMKITFFHLDCNDVSIAFDDNLQDLRRSERKERGVQSMNVRKRKGTC